MREGTADERRRGEAKYGKGENGGGNGNGNGNEVFRLSRYGGGSGSGSNGNGGSESVASPDPSDALNPFPVREVDYGEEDGNAAAATETAAEEEKERGDRRRRYDVVSSGDASCPYDLVGGETEDDGEDGGPMQLLKRVSIGNLVDFSADFLSREGWAKLATNYVSKSDLVEPTYEEVSLAECRGIKLLWGLGEGLSTLGIFFALGLHLHQPPPQPAPLAVS